MIWHFASLGMEDSIWTCTNGTVNSDYDTTPGDCKLDTKPQPQWVNNWLSNPLRNSVYNTFSKLNNLKMSEPVFNGDYSISPDGNNIRQRIYVFNNSLPSTQLRNVVIIANFSVAAQNINPSFPFTGTWYDLMTDTAVNITNATATINLAPGEFRVYGNRLPTLSTESVVYANDFSIYPNPTSDVFSISVPTSKVEVYNITGQLMRKFEASFDESHMFSINDLTTGIYFVKATDLQGRENTMKLIKK
jgi:hypothetical protein